MTAGKGDTRRPSAVGAAEFAERWQRTFGAAARKAETVDYVPCGCDRPEDEDDSAPEGESSPPCNHPAHAWRRCADCRAEYGDLQYQRMKEGDL